MLLGNLICLLKKSQNCLKIGGGQVIRGSNWNTWQTIFSQQKQYLISVADVSPQYFEGQWSFVLKQWENVALSY